MTEESTPALSADVIRRRADLFVEVMRAIAPDLSLDYTPTSVAALESFVASTFDPPGSVEIGPNLPVDMGCYVGETIARAFGGAWSQETPGQLDQVGEIRSLWPVQKAFKRFQHGAEHDLGAYLGQVGQHARARSQAA